MSFFSSGSAPCHRVEHNSFFGYVLHAGVANPNIFINLKPDTGLSTPATVQTHSQIDAGFANPGISVAPKKLPQLSIPTCMY